MLYVFARGPTWLILWTFPRSRTTLCRCLSQSLLCIFTTLRALTTDGNFTWPVSSSPERFPLSPHSMKLFRRIQKLAWTCYPCYRCVVIQSKSGLCYLTIIIWLWLKVGVINFSKLLLCEKFDKQFKKCNTFHKLCVSAYLWWLWIQEV